MRPKYLWAIGIFLVVAIGLVLSWNPIVRQLDAWKVLPRPERLTELYFTDHQALPTKYEAGGDSTVRFTVHNLEYRRTTYHYRVVQTDKDGNNPQQLAQGNVGLEHDASQRVGTPIIYADSGQRAKIAVELTYDGIAWGRDEPSTQTQSIFYFVDQAQPSASADQPPAE